VAKSRKTSWAEHVKRRREIRNTNKVLVGKHERSIHLGDIDIDGRITLKCNLNK
jgi:hypothetical protein